MCRIKGSAGVRRFHQIYPRGVSPLVYSGFVCRKADKTSNNKLEYCTINSPKGLVTSFTLTKLCVDKKAHSKLKDMMWSCLYLSVEKSICSKDKKNLESLALSLSISLNRQLPYIFCSGGSSWKARSSTSLNSTLQCAHEPHQMANSCWMQLSNKVRCFICWLWGWIGKSRKRNEDLECSSRGLAILLRWCEWRVCGCGQMKNQCLERLIVCPIGWKTFVWGLEGFQRVS